ncbi:hypothetical protein AKO1_002546 [Acrasis kona]|uniref:Chitin-binding type-4 domain-containing protein n=1 Tax=Acrasis kona TaxID=1008807 RepID=A0AAW2ZLL0_9EUKA
MSYLITLLLAATVYAHLCILDPPQRGGFNVSTPGSRACFQSKGPCGKFGPEQPKTIVKAGVPFKFFFQQNLNHFQIGNPGYFDVAISKGIPSEGVPEKDEDFNKIDGFIPDYFAHKQWMQTNLTYELTIPSGFSCEHCVVRFRYISHKQNEPDAFHQCVDVKVIPSNTLVTKQRPIKSLSSIKNKNEVKQPNFLTVVQFHDRPLTFWNIHQFKQLSYPSIVKPIQQNVRNQRMQIKQDELVDDAINDGIVTFDTTTKQAIYSVSRAPTRRLNETITNLLYISTTGSHETKMLNISTAVSSIHYDSATDSLLAVRMVSHSEKKGFHAFQVIYVNKNTADITPVLTTEYSDRFVDFIWSEFDTAGQNLFILARDEDDPQMSQRIFHIDLKQKSVASDFVLDPAHSFSAVHFVSSQGLFAISQGVPFKYGDSPITFKLLKIDTLNKAAVPMFDLPIQTVQDWNGNMRHIQGRENDNILYHIYRLESGVRAMFDIDVTNPLHKPKVEELGILSQSEVYNPIAIY